MANTLPSIYMSLPVPVPTVQVGPQWATDINTCLTQIDSHTHSSGSGQQITPAGISINQDLPFYNNNATLLRSARFQAQATPISGPSDLRCLYSSSADLYFNDSAGNQIRLTQNGGVAGTPGSIGGLLSPASLSYISGSQTFVFQSSTATPANIDVGAITIRNILANSKGITISPPAALANNYSLTLPATIPTSGVKFLTIDNTGNIADNVGVDNSTIGFDVNTSIGVKNFSIGPQQLTPSNFVASSSCGDFSGSPATTAVITNLNCTITTAGLRPIHITAVHDGSANPAGIAMSRNPISGSADAKVWVMKNDVRIAFYRYTLTVASAVDGAILYPNLVNHYDLTPTSGAVTYSLRLDMNSQILSVNRFKLLVMEV